MGLDYHVTFCLARFSLAMETLERGRDGFYHFVETFVLELDESGNTQSEDVIMATD